MYSCDAWVLTQPCLCLDRAGPWQTYPGQAQVLRERTEGKSERGEEGKEDEQEETQLFGEHEGSGGKKLRATVTYKTSLCVSIPLSICPTQLNIREILSKCTL